MFSLSRRNVLSTTLYLIACSMALLLNVAGHTVAHAAPPAQTSAQNLQLIDRLSGTTTNLAIKGNYAYVKMGDHLVVMDISNPATPVYLTSTKIRGESVYYMAAIDMFIADDLLYLFSGNLHIISVSDPLYPVEVGTFAVTPYIVGSVAQGPYLYVPGLDADFTIVDVTKPASPIQAARYTYPEGTATGYSWVAVQGNYVYLFSDRARGLLILDISDRANPQLVGRLDVTYSAKASIAIVGEMVYLSYSDWLGDARIEELELIDVSDPAAPRRKGKIVTPSGGHLLKNIKVSGNYVYWGGDPDWGITHDIKIVNVTDPEHPVLETALTFNPYAFVVAENHLYSVHYQYGLQIFDLSTPLTPTLMSSYHPGGNIAFDTIHIRDNFLYATDYNGLRIHDLSTPNQRVVGSLAVRGDWAALDGNTAYLNWPQSLLYGSDCYGYHAVDVTNPFSPTLALTHQFGCSANGDSMAVLAVANQRLYASNYSKLYIYDLTVPDAPTLLGTYGQVVHSILFNGQYAYLGGWETTGMVILDVSSTTTPTVVSVYPALDPVIRLIKRDSYLFALTTSGVTVFDITNPISPVVIGVVEYHDDRGHIDDFALEGDYIYVDVYLYLTEGSNIKVFDIADLDKPTEVASYLTDQPLGSPIATADHKLYMTNGSGLAILQLSGAISGKVVDSFGNPHAGVKVTLSDGQTRETRVQGDYSFASLPPSNYTVKVESPPYDFQPSEQTLRVPSYSSDSVNFTLLLKPLSTMVMPDAPAHLSFTDLVGNMLQFDLPSGAVAQPTTLSVLPQASATTSGQFFTGIRFDLQTGEASSASSNFTFTAPLTITLHYTDLTVAPVTDRDQLMLRWWNGSQWLDATTTCAAATPALHNLESQVLTTTVCQSGQFALFGPTVQYFLPLVSRSQVATSAEMPGHFVAQHSGKCLNVLDESQQNGANLDQMPCDNRDSEIWTVRPQGEYAQLAAKHSQKCLRVESQVEGAPVIQWSCTGADAELWRLVSIDSTGSSGNTFGLVDKQSGLCLTVQDASQEDEAQVIQRACSESQNQIWRFQAAN